MSMPSDRRAFVQTLGALVLAGCSAPTRIREIDAGADTEATETANQIACAEGPYGLNEGDTFPLVEVSAYHDGRGAWGPLQLCEYSDPDGSRGIHALLVSISAAWCGPCGVFMEHVVKAAPQYLVRGLRICELLLEQNDIDHTAADKKAVDDWIARHKLYFDAGIAPRELLPPGDVGFPLWYLVNPRTMKIVDRVSGGEGVTDTEIPGVDALLRMNGH